MRLEVGAGNDDGGKAVVFWRMPMRTILEERRDRSRSWAFKTPGVSVRVAPSVLNSSCGSKAEHVGDGCNNGAMAGLSRHIIAMRRCGGFPFESGQVDVGRRGDRRLHRQGRQERDADNLRGDHLAQGPRLVARIRCVRRRRRDGRPERLVAQAVPVLEQEQVLIGEVAELQRVPRRCACPSGTARTKSSSNRNACRNVVVDGWASTLASRRDLSRSGSATRPRSFFGQQRLKHPSRRRR